MSLICPACGSENIIGSDRCEECLSSLMQISDLPLPKPTDKVSKMLMEVPVSDVIRDNKVLIAAMSDPIAKVVDKMSQNNKSCILIYWDHRMVGIISERRLLTHVALKKTDLQKVSAGEVMTRDPEFVRPGDPLAVALNKMALCRFRHIPIIDDNDKPLSILSIQDVLLHLLQRHNQEDA